MTSAKAFGQRAALDFPSYAPAWVAQGDAFAADGNPKAARTAYETGQGTSLDLVTAASSHRQLEINLVLREYDVVSAELNALFVQSTCTL